MILKSICESIIVKRISKKEDYAGTASMGIISYFISMKMNIIQLRKRAKM